MSSWYAPTWRAAEESMDTCVPTVVHCECYYLHATRRANYKIGCPFLIRFLMRAFSTYIKIRLQLRMESRYMDVKFICNWGGKGWPFQEYVSDFIRYSPIHLTAISNSILTRRRPGQACRHRRPRGVGIPPQTPLLSKLSIRRFWITSAPGNT